MREGGRVLVPVERRSGDGCDVTVFGRQAAALVAERSVPGWFVPLQGSSQDRRAGTLVAPPTGEATARRSLPLGMAGDSGPAPAAALFRAFLGRTEPGFVMTAPDEDIGWRPGRGRPPLDLPVPPFGLAEADGSVALWQGGEVASYGGGGAAARLARAYARWAELGLPGAGAWGLEVHKAGAALPAGDRVWAEARGETVLAWRLKPGIGNWSELAG